MSRLGDFGQAVEAPAEPDTFGWFGVDVRVAEDFGELVFTDWVEEFGAVDEGDPKAVTATKQLMRRLVHQDDFESFWRLAVKNRQGSADLARLMQQVIEAVSARPTQSPTGSSGGRVSTVPSSKVGSSSPVIDRLEAAGRADLALVHVQAAEARRAG